MRMVHVLLRTLRSGVHAAIQENIGSEKLTLLVRLSSKPTSQSSIERWQFSGINPLRKSTRQSRSTKSEASQSFPKREQRGAFSADLSHLAHGPLRVSTQISRSLHLSFAQSSMRLYDLATMALLAPAEYPDNDDSKERVVRVHDDMSFQQLRCLSQDHVSLRVERHANPLQKIPTRLKHNITARHHHCSRPRKTWPQSNAPIIIPPHSTHHPASQTCKIPTPNRNLIPRLAPLRSRNSTSSPQPRNLQTHRRRRIQREIPLQVV